MDAPVSGPDELPRFLVAVSRYEDFLAELAVEHSDTEEQQRLTLFSEIMTACGGLTKAAQRYDYALSTPSLVGTNAETVAGKSLHKELTRTDLPKAVRTIYTDLYGQDVAKYAEEADTE